jgi:hypothetical protein
VIGELAVGKSHDFVIVGCRKGAVVGIIGRQRFVDDVQDVE